MTTPAQLRLAADILETGHPWEYKSLCHDEWSEGNAGIVAGIAWGHEIRPVLATPPYPATLHNPDNLTAEQVGVGYRLVLPSEIDGRFANQCEGWWYGKWQKADMAQDKTSTYRLPLSVPWPEQPKPFTLPTPPPGMHWHREDWTAEMLPPGTRPMTKGEVRLPGDSIFPTYGSDSWRNKWQTVERDGWDHPQYPCNEESYHSRTTRPLLFTHSGHEWTWHRAGDPCPCDGERRVDVLLSSLHLMVDCNPETVRWSELKLCDGSKAPGDVIGWRYADAPLPIQTLAQDQVDLTSEMQEAASQVLNEEMQKTDPYAEFKKAHAEGKVIQRHVKTGWIDHVLPSEREPIWFHPAKDLRIKPDEIPWTEWHGGPCPLNDDEVEEWEYKLRDGLLIPSNQSPKPSGCIWRHDEDGSDIIAYRVLKTREPKPKVPLGPEDVTPFTLFRVKLECGVVERVTSWITPLAISTQGVKFHWPLDPVSWTRLARDYERNNSLETGKWDATKWEACEK